MSAFYSLKINFRGDGIGEKITAIIGEKPNAEHSSWELERAIQEGEMYTDYISYFLNLLDGNYDKLSTLGIERDHISIWLLYEYAQQCNMEFLPHHMKRMGENGIVLCISCWQKDSL